MPTNFVPRKVPKTDATASETAYTSTYTYDPQPKEATLKDKLRFYRAAIKWLWKHRMEPNNRHKWRRMMREVQE